MHLTHFWDISPLLVLNENSQNLHCIVTSWNNFTYLFVCSHTLACYKFRYTSIETNIAHTETRKFGIQSVLAGTAQMYCKLFILKTNSTGAATECCLSYICFVHCWNNGGKRLNCCSWGIYCQTSPSFSLPHEHKHTHGTRNWACCGFYLGIWYIFNLQPRSAPNGGLVTRLESMIQWHIFSFTFIAYSRLQGINLNSQTYMFLSILVDLEEEEKSNCIQPFLIHLLWCTAAALVKVLLRGRRKCKQVHCSSFIFPALKGIRLLCGINIKHKIIKNMLSWPTTTSSEDLRQPGLLLSISDPSW